MSTARQPGDHEGPVLVGVDGSEPSQAALRWAAHYAERTGQPLHVVLAWHVPTDYGWSLPPPGDWNPEADASATLEREVAEVLGPDAGDEVTLTTIEGPAAQVLIEESRKASVVVVASRGHGQLAGMLLGSVSGHLTAHAHCPVVVVRDEGPAAPTDPAAGVSTREGEPERSAGAAAD